PTWMWRNVEVADFVAWLGEFNLRHEGDVGFYGLDLYSLYRSIAAVVSYLERIDPLLARDARTRYACFEGLGQEPQAYGYTVNYGALQSCEANVVLQLIEMQRLSVAIRQQDGRRMEDESFFAEQNARLVKN